MILASPALASEWELSPSSLGETIATVSVQPGVVTLTPNVPFERVRFVVSGPDGIVFDRLYTETPISWQVEDYDGNILADGRYNFELRFDFEREQARPADLGESPEVKREEAVERHNVSGSFSVEGGTIDTSYRSSIPSRAVAQLRDPMAAPTTKAYDDDFLFVQSKIGVGIDDSAIVPNAALHIQEQTPTGILLEERVGAYGTDVEGQWRLKATSNNFTIGHDPTPTTSGGERENFVIEEGGEANALYIDNSGAIGLGTTTPFGSLEISDPDTFVQLSFTANNGVDWVGSIEGVAGTRMLSIEGATEQNIVNLHLDSPGNVLNVDANGRVGLGTTAPDRLLHVRGADTTATRVQVDNTSGIADTRILFKLENRGPTQFAINNTQTSAQWTFSVTNSGFVISRAGTGVQEAVFAGGGNMTIAGTLTQGSSKDSKEDFQAIDSREILDRVANLPISNWTYRHDSPNVRHLGPMAEDFHAAFGLGRTEKGITTLDTSGVALAAIQGLVQENQELKQRLEKLEAMIVAMAE
jgi:hypothetical protein